MRRVLRIKREANAAEPKSTQCWPTPATSPSTPGRAPTATRGATSLVACGWSFASSFARTIRRPAPSPGSAASTSATWQAAPALRAPPVKPPECYRPPTPYRFARSNQNKTSESRARTGVKAEVGIDQAFVGAPHGLAQRRILQTLAIGETAERLGLERLQSQPRGRPSSWAYL